ncbi:hypothetical protein M3J09_010546 [Ascochyta lentis]
MVRTQYAFQRTNLSDCHCWSDSGLQSANRFSRSHTLVKDKNSFASLHRPC